MNARRHRFVLAAAALAVTAIATSATAQITTATVSGSVRDTTGGALPGANIALVNEARGITLAEAVTNSTGGFVLPNVTAGTDTVQVTLDGFKVLKRAGIAVSPGDRVVIPVLTLEVGTVAETVTVTAEKTMIQAGSGERSFTVSTESVQNLP